MDAISKFKYPLKFGVAASLLALLTIVAIIDSGYCTTLTALNEMGKFSRSVVSVKTASLDPDYSVPWNPGKMHKTSGTGFVVAGDGILTNAHLTGNARFITVKKQEDSRLYEARVKFIAHDCDLAMLEVPDKSFFHDITPLQLGQGLPRLDSNVKVLGYPIGGKRLSVTRGVVSRVGFQPYTHSSADSHLVIQIDAAINPGNSGGPVLQAGKVIGIAFQGFSGDVAQNVGYIIPIPVIERFLRDIEDGRYDHYMDLGISHFPLLNSAQRRALGLGPGDYGVMVTHVMAAGSSAGILNRGDVLLAIEGHRIFADGTIDFQGQHIQLEEVVERKLKGDSVQLRVLSKGQEKTVSVPLKRPWPYLMHSRRYGVRPRFVLFAGLVFQPLSKDFLAGHKVRKIEILHRYASYLKKGLYIERPEIVLLSKILDDPINTYLKDLTYSIVDKINGKEIKTLEDVSRSLSASSKKYIIEFADRHRPAVLEGKSVKNARKRILENYGVLKEEYLGDSIVPKDWRNGLPKWQSPPSLH